MHPWLFRAGQFGLPTRGVCIALGLVAAMVLGQRIARRVGVNPERFWDLGFTGIVAVFAVSRLELVLANWKVFRTAPLVVLAQPSVSAMGLLAAGLLSLGYARWKRMPLLATVDAAAVCGTLLLIFVHIGDLFAGNDVGLATLSLPGRLLRGEGIFAVIGLHPTALYAAIGSALVLAVLFWWLPRRSQPGEVFGLAVSLGAVARFWVDCYRVESVLDLKAPWDLDPDQVVMLIVVLIGAAFWLRWPRANRAEVNHAV